ncbi:MAG: hypothetical protein ABW194_03485 [Novosphingobium sp.]
MRSDAVVRLLAGDALTLLDARGTRRLKGPGRFRLNRAGPPEAGDLQRVSETLKALVAPPSSRTRVGGVRGFKIARKANAAGATEAPVASTSRAGETLWFVDRAVGGRYCLPVDGSPTVPAAAGPDSQSASGADLVRELTGEAMDGDDASDAAEDMMPPGIHAMTRADGTPGTIEVILVAIPAPAVDAVATVLLENGCERQLEFLLDRLGSTGTR